MLFRLFLAYMIPSHILHHFQIHVKSNNLKLRSWRCRRSRETSRTSVGVGPAALQGTGDLRDGAGNAAQRCGAAGSSAEQSAAWHAAPRSSGASGEDKERGAAVLGVRVTRNTERSGQSRLCVSRGVWADPCLGRRPQGQRWQLREFRSGNRRGRERSLGSPAAGATRLHPTAAELYPLESRTKIHGSGSPP